MTKFCLMYYCLSATLGLAFTHGLNNIYPIDSFHFLVLVRGGTVVFLCLHKCACTAY